MRWNVVDQTLNQAPVEYKWSQIVSKGVQILHKGMVFSVVFWPKTFITFHTDMPHSPFAKTVNQYVSNKMMMLMDLRKVNITTWFGVHIKLYLNGTRYGSSK